MTKYEAVGAVNAVAAALRKMPEDAVIAGTRTADGIATIHLLEGLDSAAESLGAGEPQVRAWSSPLRALKSRFNRREFTVDGVTVFQVEPIKKDEEPSEGESE